MESETGLNKLLSEEWNHLSIKEKAICLNYARQLMNNKLSPSKKMIDAITEIHERHEGFCMACVPYGESENQIYQKELA
jgi:hypothetical protein